jgi:hypothetical protein
VIVNLPAFTFGSGCVSDAKGSDCQKKGDGLQVELGNERCDLHDDLEEKLDRTKYADDGSISAFSKVHFQKPTSD